MKLKISSLLILFVSAYGVVVSQNIVPDTVERKALLAIYQATGGANWKPGQKWTLSKINSYPDSALYGVSLQNGDIESITLFNNNLTGSIPPELNDLSQLYFLQIRSNPGLT